MGTAAATRDFFLCDLFGAAPKDDLASMEHPLFSLSTRPDLTVRRYDHNGVTVTVTPSVRGRATMHDKDILIYCISQLVAALNAGRAVARTLRLTAHDLLTATRRDTGGDAYLRLTEAFERLAGTRITTNIAQGGLETTAGFGLIEAWEIVRRSRGGRMISVSVTLSDWLFRAVNARAVLTLNRDYFGLRKPLERRVYELARKHCGQQRDWAIGLATLQHKCGSDAPIRVFRAAIRRMIAAQGLPDYRLAEEPGDLIRVTRVSVIEDGPLLPPTAPERLRALAPGWDVYALIAEWQGFWLATGRPRLRAPEAALLAWAKGRITRG
jgi:plasmid replication initiation protein